MSILIARNLSKSYGPHDIFAEVSLDIPHGAKIALVGPNGSGKTTLLHILAGLEVPSSGTVQKAKDLRIGYLPQQAEFSEVGTLWDVMLGVFAQVRAQAAELRRLEAAMADPATRERSLELYGKTLEAFELAGGYTYETRIRQVLSGLGFGPADLERPLAQLSGGQKTRALLARLLLEEPDLLLMDEPTNHLDLAGIEWLESYLRTWKGAVLVVAHDRAFLDAVVEEVWDLAWGKLEGYRGNYSAYALQRAERTARQQAEYERQQQTISQTEDFIRRHMAGQRTREAQGRQKRLERLERLERPQDYQPIHLSFGTVERSGDLVLGLYDLTVGYEPDTPLVAVEECELRRGQRVALLGPNGSGKTSLIRTVLGEIPPLGGRVRRGANVQFGYFVQGHTNLDGDRTVLDTLIDAGGMLISEARDLLAQYRFFGDDVFKRVGDLSGGEQARVALALLALQGANALLMDEPTNHLDIPSQEVLQDVMARFAGTLLLVTHDRYLINNLAAQVWAVEDGRLWTFKEGYEEYRAWLQARRTAAREPEEPQRAAEAQREQEREARRAAEREQARRSQQQADTEAAIHQLESRLAHLGAEVAEASAQHAVERVRELGLEYSAVEAELNKLVEIWTNLADPNADART
ncbi:MAG: ABC-F family ATP-binding cassette domain-containing protein [Anaerolineales bacterium]|nr:ABC-F family ATP-binding cassette domain-containing protein [Anaerolineales bacterium]